MSERNRLASLHVAEVGANKSVIGEFVYKRCVCNLFRLASPPGVPLVCPLCTVATRLGGIQNWTLDAFQAVQRCVLDFHVSSSNSSQHAQHSLAQNTLSHEKKKCDQSEPA